MASDEPGVGLALPPNDRGFLLATIFANPLENHAFANDFELFDNGYRYLKIIISPAVKVQNFAALGAMQMMVVGHIGVETPGSAKYFNDIHNFDLCESQKRAVHRIEGDAGIFCFQVLIDRIGCGMGVRLDELLKNCNSLGGYFELMGVTDLSERDDFIVVFIILHIDSK